MDHLDHLADRTVIRLSGDDRRDFLQGLITQDMDRLDQDGALFAALLTPQGKILFDFFVAGAGDALLIDCHRETAPALLKRLSLYKLRAKVSLEIAEDLHVIASDKQIDEDCAFADPRLEGLGWRAIGTSSQTAGGATYHARRIALGVPEFGADFDSDDKFLLDVNYDMLNGVSYKKGCFIGQEVTSRMKRKGEVRRRTVIAEFAGSAPAKGSSIIAGASTLGETMSAAGDLALAQIRLDRWGKAQTDETPVACAEAALQLRIPAYLEQD